MAFAVISWNYYLATKQNAELICISDALQALVAEGAVDTVNEFILTNSQLCCVDRMEHMYMDTFTRVQCELAVKYHIMSGFDSGNAEYRLFPSVFV
jgi:hypothetical protein